jgi:hypothetical protein
VAFYEFTHCGFWHAQTAREFEVADARLAVDHVPGGIIVGGFRLAWSGAETGELAAVLLSERVRRPRNTTRNSTKSAAATVNIGGGAGGTGASGTAGKGGKRCDGFKLKYTLN